VHLVRARAGCPINRAALEVVVPSRAIRGGRLVRQRVAEEAALPAQLRPQPPDRAMHLARARAGCPIDRAALKVVVAPDSVRRHALVGRRVAQKAALPADRRPQPANGTVDLMGGCLRVPVDRPVGIVPIVADAVWRGVLTARGPAEPATGTTERCVLVVDSRHRAVLLRASSRRGVRTWTLS
jgi:hypothetical protein